MEEKYKLEHIEELSFELCKPLYTTNRIKYTCYDASKTYIICGASSGSLYFFMRQPCKFLQLIPNLSGAINHVAISPQENYIAFTTQRGSIHIYVIDLTTVQPTILSSHYHEMNITQIQWKLNEKQLFLGDVKGNVYLVNLNLFLGRNLTMSIHPVLFLESPIVQICELDHLLLVSNFNKCIICNTDTEEFKQIGNQPRDGKFGTCFVTDPRRTRVICARPGGRIWECNIDGNVMKTHKFKSILESEPPIKIVSNNCDSQLDSMDFFKHQINDQLFDLQNLNKSFVLGYTSNAFYIFDMERSSIVLWANNFGNIHSIKTVSGEFSTILLFTTDQKAYSFQLNQLEDTNDEILDNEPIIYDEKLNNINRTPIIREDEDSENNVSESKKKTTDSNLIGSKPVGLSEEDKILQNLFFIYKSLKMSKFNLKERYAEFFDTYDFHYIKHLLNILETMIIENDGDVTQSEAKKICAEIYLDYIKVDAIPAFSDELEDFVIDCLILVNSDKSSKNMAQRCYACDFPVIVARFELQYQDIGETIAKRLVKAEKIQRLFEVIWSIPAVLGILLKILITNSSMIKSSSIGLDNIVDIFFASGNQSDIDHLIQNCDHFSTFNFWKDFLTRLIQLHNQHTIKCFRCKNISNINYEPIQSETFYSYNYAFNKCVNLTSGSAALQLCTMAAKYIPRNGIDRNFYIECLLNDQISHVNLEI